MKDLEFGVPGQKNKKGVTFIKWFVWVLVLIVGATVNGLIKGSGFEYTWGFFIGGIALLVHRWFEYYE